MTRSWPKKAVAIGGVGALLLSGVLTACSAARTSAETLDWVGATLTYNKVPGQTLFPPTQPGCIDTTTVLTVARGETKTAHICLVDKGAWSYGKYNYGERNWWGGTTTIQGYAVRIGTSGPMHRLPQGLPDSYFDVPGSDDIITLGRRSSMDSYLYVYKDFKDKLIQQMQPDGEIQYSYDATPDFTLTRPGGEPLAMRHSPGISNNGQWAAVETDVGFLRINLRTLQVKRFTSLTLGYNLGMGPKTQLAITNDGQHVAVAGGHMSLGGVAGFHLYDISDGCGDTLTDVMTKDTPMGSPCPSGSFASALNDNIPDGVDYAEFPSFDDGGGQLTVFAHATSGPIWVRLTVDGYTPPIHITYLALGDSYSSGEGDITDGETHYLPGTGGGNGCHLSDRSYPFLLRDYYGIPANNMESVACSGAQVAADYIGFDKNYFGQGYRLQKRGLYGDKLKAERAQALDQFTPGEIKQVDFVKKYQPSIITLTGGGNDVGFADILRYCANPSWEMLFVDDTCGYAKPGSELNKMLYDSIDSQYTIDKVLIDELKQASPNSRIVLVGYPSFVGGPNAICGADAGALNDKERSMINEGVHYMDSMLASLAHEMNISYVDTENALVGGRVCEPLGYVNGVWNVGLKRASEGNVAMFHPNALGHEKIAQAIESSGVFEGANIPGSADYVARPGTTTTLPQTLIAGGEAVVGHAFKIASNPFLFLPGSNITSMLYSDPIKLGTFRASSDGGLSASVSTDNLPIGQHVLVLEGTDYTGKPVKYYQFISLAEASISGHVSTSSREPTTKEGDVPGVDESDSTNAVQNNDSNVDRQSDYVVPKVTTDNSDHTRISKTSQIWPFVAGFTILLIGGVAYAIYRKKY